MADPTGSWGITKAEPGRISVARAEFRVTLVLGDFDSLCEPKTDPLGCKQRLQMIGAFLEPLSGKWADWRYKTAFRHYAAELSSPAATAAAAQDALVTAVGSEIIVLDGVAQGAASALPQGGQFAKIRLPGGFVVNSNASWRGGIPQRFRFDAETHFFDANPLLGAIPLVAQVEQRTSPSAAWTAAPAGIQVHFQLLVPDPLPAGNSVTAEPARDTTVVLGGKGPKGYLADQYAVAPAQANDPQADNCTTDRGGKRRPGAGSAADYFETVARKGFGPTPFPVAAASSHPLAVCAATNANGEAGVIFRPSRQGGDRFKLRAFLDPVGVGGVASDGTDAKAVRADSGTLVVWRTLRISGYHQFDYPAGTSAADKTAAGGALGTVDFAELAKAYSRAYMELVVERGAKRRRHVIGDAFWVQQVEYARKSTRAQPSGVSQRYDIGALFPRTNTTPGLFNVRVPADYDTARGAAFPAAPASQAVRTTDWEVLVVAFMHEFMQGLTGNAVPGLVIVQAPWGDSITAQTAASVELTTSGQAAFTRGCFLFYGSDRYRAMMPYSVTANALHEMGHCLYFPHQWTDRNPATGAVWGGIPQEHDYKDYCIMSYQRNKRNTYDYCGRCNLKLRGWDTSGIPINNK
jgi:hypothetical protein